MGDLGLNVTVVTFGLHSYADTSDCIVSFLTSPHRSPCTIRSCISLVCDVISSLVRVRYPQEAPLAMPVQSLTRFSRKERRSWAAPALAYRPWATRLFVFGGALALTFYGAYQMYKVVQVGVITLLEWALVVLFVANFSWIAVAFTSGVVGFVWLLFRAPARGALPERLTKKTAVVMPIYNEAPARVFATLQAIFEEVQATGHGAAFDWFFLSDTTNPEI